MKTLFALLVGINDYHPQSGVTGLNGCINDVTTFEKYLLERFPNDACRAIKLTNEKATRENVIKTFITHLIENESIQKGDTILLYYSGHGSYARSNSAFEKFDPQRRDETLVLYDSRCAGNFDLADKELALLIHAVPKEVSIVLVIDSCHSGSITRSMEAVDALKLGKPKHTPAVANDGGRKLADYLSVRNLSYEQMLTQGQLKIPYTRHVVLSACSRGEVAYENSHEATALFTSQLLTVLTNSHENLSYLELYDYLNTMLARYAKKQTPELSVFEGFDPRKVFLGEDIKDAKSVFRVTCPADSNTWTIDCGAIHGLRNDQTSTKNASVLIQTEAGKNISVLVDSVGLNKSELAPFQLPRGVYKALVVNLPPIIAIRVLGTETAITSWMKFLAGRKAGDRILFVDQSTGGKIDYILRLGENITIHRPDAAETLIHGVQGNTENESEYMYKVCQQIYDWNKLLQLENSQMSAEDFRSDFKTEFSISLAGLRTNEPQLVTDIADVCIDVTKQPIVGQISLRNHGSDRYHVALYYMSDDFRIVRVSTDNPDQALLSKDNTVAGVDRPFKMNLSDGTNYNIDRYKLIISKEPFHDFEIPRYNKIERKVIEKPIAYMAREADFDSTKIDQTWYAKTITIRLHQSSGVVDSQQSVSLGNISLSSHPSFKASAAINPIRRDTKDIHPSRLLEEIIKQSGYSLVPLGGSTKDISERDMVITLSEFENEEHLKEYPLELTLNHLHDHDKEEIIAMTLQDGILVPLGIAAPVAEGKSVVSIDSLPENQVVPDGENKKNFVRAVWFCLVKVALKTNPSRLSWIDFANDSKYKQEGVAEKVLTSNKILLVIHGIIGDTKGQVACMKYLVPDTYDLMLAYDYENLNTGIENIALDLFNRLKVAGINGATKTIDIVAHSMGGLVSRYLIEHVKETDGWVNKLYMFGTPNGGSEFGNIRKWQDRLIGILTLACNTGKSFLGAIGPFLEAFNKGLVATKIATNTLGQMRPGSSFYELLNKSPENIVKTKYFVIAGNIQAYKAPDGPWFGRLIESIELKIGKIVYKESPNDIAVAVSSIHDIKNIPVVKAEVVGCHHLNYFDTEVSVSCFKNLEKVAH